MMTRTFIVSQLFVTPAFPSKSFAGQTVIVTGANVGLGNEAARHIARLGASKVILAVRNTAAGEEARQSIISATRCTPDAVEVWQLDLADFGSVKTFAKRALENLQRIDVLLENAGIHTEDFTVSEGYERTLTVNVISTLLLALLLYPKMKSTARQFQVQPRLTIVTSEVHGWVGLPEAQSKSVFETLNDQSTANMKTRYHVSKLLEVLLVRHLAPQMQGSGVILNMVNPGLCQSAIHRDMDLPVFFSIVKRLLARTTEVGSRNLVAAASAGEESHGAYLSDGVVMNDMVSKFAQSENGIEAGKKVWCELKSILEGIHPNVAAEFK